MFALTDAALLRDSTKTTHSGSVNAESLKSSKRGRGGCCGRKRRRNKRR